MNKKFLIGILVGTMLALSACSVDQIAQGAGPDQAIPANPAGGNIVQANPPGDGAVTPETPADQPEDAGDGQTKPVPEMSPEQVTAIDDFARVTVGILYLQDNQPGSITTEQASALLVTYQDVQTSLQAAREAAGTFPGSDGGPDGNKGGPGPKDGQGGPDGGPGQNGGQDGPGGPGGPGFDGRKGGRGGIDGFRILAEQDLGKLQQYITSIRSSLTAEQLDAVDALTEDQLQATLEQHGIGMRFQDGQHPSDGTPGAPPQTQGTPSPDQVATMQAQGVPDGPGPHMNGNPVIEEVIKILTEIAS